MFVSIGLVLGVGMVREVFSPLGGLGGHLLGNKQSMLCCQSEQD
jgi:hypothetical protein